MIFDMKNGLFVVLAVLVVILQSSCDALDKLRIEDNGSEETTVAHQTAQSEPAEASVMEPFTEQSSEDWHPILPHELDAQFEESDILLKLFRYSRRIGKMTTKQLEQEYHSFQHLKEPQKSAITAQLQYAILLSAQMASFRNYEGAKKILTKIINSKKKRGLMLREYAYNLLVSIDENEKSERQNLLLRRKLKSEIARREALEQKLEALKSIEESMTQRQNNPEEAAP